MNEETFKLRLAKLRTLKGVSARDMSLSLGQNAGYVNNIETGKALPSMAMFFCICDYLGVTPVQFFDDDNMFPAELDKLTDDLKKLNSRQLSNISEIVGDLVKK